MTCACSTFLRTRRIQYTRHSSRIRRGIFLKNDVCIGSSLSEGMYCCCSCFVGGCFPGEIRRWNGKGMIEGIYMRMELSKVNSFWYGLEMEGKEYFNQSSNSCG